MSLARERPRVHNHSFQAGLVILVVVLVAIGAWAFLALRPESAVAAKRDITATEAVTGTVVAPPMDRADIMAPFQAPVESVLTTLGANVKRGAVLLELTAGSGEVAIRQAAATEKAAEIAYAAARRDYLPTVASAERQLSAARAAERAARGTRSSHHASGSGEDVGAAQSGNPNLTDTDTISPNPNGSTDTNPPAGTTGGTAGIGSAAGTTSSSAASSGANGPASGGLSLSAAMQARASAEQTLAQARADRDAALFPLQQQLDITRQELAQARAGGKIGEIRSPINGTVLALNVQPGVLAGKDPKVPLVTVVNLDHLELQGPVDHAASSVKVGMPADVTVKEIASQHFRAAVEAVTTDVRSLGRIRYVAVLHLDNPDGVIKPGMKASAGIHLGEVTNVLAVPEDAVEKDATGRPVVNVLKSGHWQRTIVEVGLTDGHYTEIRSGLQEGDTVQVRPRFHV